MDVVEEMELCDCIKAVYITSKTFLGLSNHQLVCFVNIGNLSITSPPFYPYLCSRFYVILAFQSQILGRFAV